MEEIEVVEVKDVQFSGPILRCCFCLTSEKDIKLVYVNLSDFYNVFKDCGLRKNVLEQEHYNHVCVYCSRRSAQCLQFINTAKMAESVQRLFVKNESSEISDGGVELCLKPPVQMSSWIVASVSYDKSRARKKEGVSSVLVDARPIQSKYNYKNPVTIESVTLKIEDGEIKDKITTEQTDEAPFELEKLESAADGQNDDDSTINYDDSTLDNGTVEKSFEQPRASETKSNGYEHDYKVVLSTMKPIHLTREQQIAELEEKRQSSKFLNRPFKCYKCAVSYFEQQCLDSHNDMHKEERGAHVCPLCERRFADRHNLTLHEGRHRNRWVCARCDKYIACVEQVRIHYAACNATQPVQCQLCDNIYKDSVCLKRHMTKIHLDTRRYGCDACGKSFRDKKQLEYHMRIHTQEKPFECDKCGKKSATLTSHRMHIAIHERKLENDPDLYCVECDKYFKNKYNLNIHYKNSLKHNTQANFKHKCPQCPERFTMPCLVKQHVERVHVATRSHACALCGKAYLSAAALSVHRRKTHSSRVPVRDKLCTLCGRAFFRKRELENHTRTHTLERPFSCSVCGATFGHSAALYTHTKLKHKTTPGELRRRALAADGGASGMT